MLITKDILADLMKDFFIQTVRETKEYQKIIKTLNNKKNIPMDISSDIVFMRKDVLDQDEFILYCILDEIKKSHLQLSSALYPSKVFTKQEINVYSNKNYEISDITTIRLKMTEIDEGRQWIGRIDVKTLMQLRDARLITYNENTQRPLSRKTVNGTEIYQISINRAQVKSIMESLTNGTYIPNTITLNMPEDANFKYNGEELIIKDVNSFDILDGYHRYLAMSNIYNLDNSFNYSMELRIVKFSEDNAQHFIWQEDQKTKMTKLESDSFNQSNPANVVVNDLNRESPLRGCINRNNGIIDAAYMSQVVSVLYFNTGSAKNSQIVETKNELLGKFKALVDLKPNILDSKWNRKYLTAFLILCKEDIPNDMLLKETDKLYEALKLHENIKMLPTNNTLKQSHITRVRKLYNSL